VDVARIGGKEGAVDYQDFARTVRGGVTVRWGVSKGCMLFFLYGEL
jgi:hypothetical protein